jgi:hypothetical protein
VNLFWTVLVTTTSVILGTGFCFWLIQKAQEVDSPTWIFEHILCPIIRIMVLLIVVSQVYPVIDANTTSIDFWRILMRQGQFNNLLNILFFAGLLLAFMPVLSHPVFALPIQSLLTIALVFHWQYAESIDSLSLFPSFVTILKITVYMLPVVSVLFPMLSTSYCRSRLCWFIAASSNSNCPNTISRQRILPDPELSTSHVG